MAHLKIQKSSKSQKFAPLGYMNWTTTFLWEEISVLGNPMQLSKLKDPLSYTLYCLSTWYGDFIHAHHSRSTSCWKSYNRNGLIAPTNHWLSLLSCLFYYCIICLLLSFIVVIYTYKTLTHACVYVFALSRENHLTLKRGTSAQTCMFVGSKRIVQGFKKLFLGLSFILYLWRP